MTFDESGRVLLVKRGREPYLGQWSLPGGIVESGETLKQAIERELLEETSLVVDAHSFFTTFERIVRDSDGRCEYHYVLIDFVCRVLSGEPQAGDDVAEVRWTERADLQQADLTDGTLGVIMQAYEQGSHLL